MATAVATGGVGEDVAATLTTTAAAIADAAATKPAEAAMIVVVTEVEAGEEPSRLGSFRNEPRVVHHSPGTIVGVGSY